MGNFAMSCKAAEIRAGLYNIKFEPSLPVLRDVQKRAGVGGRCGGEDPFQWATVSAQHCFRQNLSNTNQKHNLVVHKRKKKL